MKPKENMINKIQTALASELEYIRLEQTKTTEEKIDEIDVILDTIKFLKDYDENIKVKGIDNMDIIERLDRNIAHQTRNGRTEIYVSTDDLEELGLTPFEHKGKVYINLNKLEKLMENYKENQPDRIMQRRNDEDWEK